MRTPLRRSLVTLFLLSLCGCSLFDPLDAGVEECEGAGCACAFEGFDLGVCAAGRTDQAEPPACLAPLDYYGVEVYQCDGLDNDCDGQTDEGCPCSARSGLGLCAVARRDGSGVCPDPARYEAYESSCDGYDNDCDGTTDEGCATCTYRGVTDGVCLYGVAREGSTACDRPANWAEREAECASDPLAGDGVDNDCDGEVDEGCACDFGGSSRGVCALGQRAEGECAEPKSYEASESSCDGYDNDCDGEVDEGCDGAPPFVEMPDAGASDADAPEAGAPDADGGTPDADAPDADGGVIKAGAPCNYLGNPHGICAEAHTDATGACARPASYEPRELSCDDGIDNNCNSWTDAHDLECSPHTPIPPPGIRASSIAVAARRTCAITQAGALSCFGDPAGGFLSGVPAGSDYISVSINERGAGCAVRRSGALVCWGALGAAHAMRPGASAQAHFVALGRTSGCVARQDDALCWRGTETELLFPFSTISGIVIDKGDRVCLWGRGSEGGAACYKDAGKLPIFNRIINTSFRRVALGVGGAVYIRGDGSVGATSSVSPFLELERDRPDRLWRDVDYSDRGGACGIDLATDEIVCWSKPGTKPFAQMGGDFDRLALASTHLCAIESNGALTCWLI